MKRDEYGDNYQAHLLEQYKLYVEMADRVSQRRDQSNRFYVTIVSALVALLVVLARLGAADSVWAAALLIAGLFGAVLSVIWVINIKSYGGLTRPSSPSSTPLRASCPRPVTATNGNGYARKAASLNTFS